MTDILNIEVTDATNAFAYGNFSIPITADTVIITTTSPLPNATNGVAYSTAIAASGGVGPYTLTIAGYTGANTWTVSGMNVTGTPTHTETDTLTLLVQDSLGVPAAGQFNLQVVAASSSFDYYIGPRAGIDTNPLSAANGNDANPGTLAAPWALTSFQNTSSNNSKMAGKRIGILAAQYTMSGITTSLNVNEANLLNIPGGTVSAQTYVGSSNTSGVYSARAATITWTGGVSVPGIIGGAPSGSGYAASVGYITIDGLIVNGNGLDANSSGGGHLVMFNNVNASRSSSLNAANTGIVVQNCELYGVVPAASSGGNYAGLFFSGAYNCVIQNNYIHDCRSAGPQPDHTDGILEIGSYGNQYINNTFYNCTGGAIESKEGNTGTICAYNYVYSCATSGFGQSSVFEGFDGGAGNPNPGPAPTTQFLHHNICDGCGPIYKETGNTNFTTISTTMYNNTVYDTNTGSVQGWLAYAQGGASSQYYSNIYMTSAGSSGSAGRPGKINLAPGAYGTVDYNCYYSATASYTAFWGLSGTAYNSLATWQTAISAEAHSISTSPGFSGSIVSGNGPVQFQLGGGSACLGTGSGGVNMGAWDGVVTAIGCSFKQSGSWP